MIKIEELEIERLEAKFGFKNPNNPLRSLYYTIRARRKNANYCCEYFCNYNRKHHVQQLLATERSKKLNLIDQGFDYNIFNRSIWFCVFYSLVSNNVSRIDNLEEVMLELFPDELHKYTRDRKSFSFKKLCEEFPNKNITSALQNIFDDHRGFGNVHKLRRRMAHSTIDGIISNDALVHDEDNHFINEAFTLSEKKEPVADFAKSLNELLSKIEERIFNCLMTHGKDCLK